MKIDKRLIFYSTDHIYLKALSQEDLDESQWVAWFNDDERCRFTQHHYYPVNKETQRAYLDGAYSNDKIQLGIVDREKDDQICGIISLNNINYINRNAEFSASIDLKLTKGKPHIYLEAVSLILMHGFQELGLKKIYGGTFNPNVVTTLERIFNFQMEGTLKNHIFKNGCFHDALMLGVFDDTVRYFHDMESD
jgi:RimJ/RimL family protein N-acetyltransferase